VFAAQKNIEKPVDVVIKTALSFGGVNAALVYKYFKEGEAKL
jgi:3-oxoacyl-(acyl-carrier-protein) synthase